MNGTRTMAADRVHSGLVRLCEMRSPNLKSTIKLCEGTCSEQQNNTLLIAVGKELTLGGFQCETANNEVLSG